MDLTHGPVTLSRTAEGLTLHASTKGYRNLGMVLTGVGVFLLVATYAAMSVGRLYFFLGPLGAISLLCGIPFSLFPGVFAQRRSVVFDTTAGVARRAAGNETAIFRAIACVRATRGPLPPNPMQLEVVLKNGSVWALHAAADSEGHRIIEQMVDEIATVTGIARG